MGAGSISKYMRDLKNFMRLDKEILEKFKNNLTINTNLSNYSWFNLGGPAEYFFKPENENQLIEFLKLNKK